MTKDPNIIPPKEPNKKNDRSKYLYLVGGIIALMIALRLLFDIALGLFFLFIGTTLVSYFLQNL